MTIIDGQFNPFVYPEPPKYEDDSPVTEIDQGHAVLLVRKNGQEDTHFFGELNYLKGRWKLDDESRDRLERYESKATADGLEEFFNTHGLPDGKD